MNRLRGKIFAILVLSLMLILVPYTARAIDIVFDPTAFAEAIRQTAQMISTVEELRRQYEHMIEMARGLPNLVRERYAAIWTPWLSAWPLSDTYGLNGAWARAVHGSPEFEEGYRTATESLDVYGPELEALEPEDAERLKRRY